MNRPVKTPRRFRRRAILLAGMQLGITGTLAWRMNQLGVKEADKFRLLAEENRINIRLQPPARGIIYDRTGNTLALTGKSTQLKLYVNKQQILNLYFIVLQS